MRDATWRKRADSLTLILSLIYTFTYVTPIYFFPLDKNLEEGFKWANYIIWAYFIVEYAAQFLLASKKYRYFKTHLVELILVIIPFFRPLRALRALLFTTKVGVRSQKTIIQSIPLLITATTILMILIMGAAVLDVERLVPESHITTPSDALWWALVTVTTIGYGDVYPITTEGRLVAGVLIIFGVAMISTLTGSFAAWILNDRPSDPE